MSGEARVHGREEDGVAAAVAVGGDGGGGSDTDEEFVLGGGSVRLPEEMWSAGFVGPPRNGMREDVPPAVLRVVTYNTHGKVRENMEWFRSYMHRLHVGIMMVQEHMMSVADTRAWCRQWRRDSGGGAAVALCSGDAVVATALQLPLAPSPPPPPPSASPSTSVATTVVADGQASLMIVSSAQWARVWGASMRGASGRWLAVELQLARRPLLLINVHANSPRRGALMPAAAARVDDELAAAISEWRRARR